MHHRDPSFRRCQSRARASAAGKQRATQRSKPTCRHAAHIAVGVDVARRESERRRSKRPEPGHAGRRVALIHPWPQYAARIDAKNSLDGRSDTPARRPKLRKRVSRMRTLSLCHGGPLFFPYVKSASEPQSRGRSVPRTSSSRAKGGGPLTSGGIFANANDARRTFPHLLDASPAMEGPRAFPNFRFLFPSPWSASRPPGTACNAQPPGQPPRSVGGDDCRRRLFRAGAKGIPNYSPMAEAGTPRLFGRSSGHVGSSANSADRGPRPRSNPPHLARLPSCGKCGRPGWRLQGDLAAHQSPGPDRRPCYGTCVRLDRRPGLATVRPARCGSPPLPDDAYSTEPRPSPSPAPSAVADVLDRLPVPRITNITARPSVTCITAARKVVQRVVRQSCLCTDGN